MSTRARIERDVRAIMDKHYPDEQNAVDDLVQYILEERTAGWRLLRGLLLNILSRTGRKLLKHIQPQHK